MNSTVKLIESVVDGATPATALAEVFSAGITAGSKVAVVDDPAYPFTGAVGKVVSIAGSYANVEFPNKGVCPLLINQLIPV